MPAALKPTFVNFDFNTSPYTGNGGISGTNVTAIPSGFNTNFAGTAGGCYITNSSAGQAVAINSGSGVIDITLSGAGLSSFSSFTGCYQAQRSSTGAQVNAITYSKDGGAFLAATSAGTAGNGSFSSITFSLPVGANNPSTSLVIRITLSGNTGGSGTYRLDNFQVRGTAAPVASITAAAISPAAFCNSAPSNASVAFTPGGGITGTFTAQLSDASGSFAAPAVIGSSTSSPINAVIPAGLTAGVGYKVRVINGSVISNLVNATINAPVVISAQPQPQNLCAGSPIALSVTAGGSGNTYNWYDGATLVQSGAGNSYVHTNAQVGDGGDYYVDILNGSCTTTSDTVTVLVDVSPTVSIAANPATICSGSIASIDFSGTPGAVVFYKVNGGPNQNLTLDAGTGLASIPLTNVTAAQTYTLVSATSAAGVCTNAGVNGTDATIIVRPTPSISAFTASSSSVCNGNAATLNFSGTANTTVAFTDNNSAMQTTALDGTGNGLYYTGALMSTATFQLTGVQYNTAQPAPILHLAV